MRRLIVDDPPGPDGSLTLTGRDAHYLRDVRRHLVGDRLEAITPDGTEMTLTILRIDRDAVTASVRPAATGQDNRRTALTMLVAIPKARVMDEIVRHLTELSVSAIAPVIGERSVVRPAEEQAGKRVARWRRIARSASGQSGAPVPTIHPILPLPDALRSPSIATETPGERTLKVVCHQDRVVPVDEDGDMIHAALAGRPVAAIACAIGPEGGFTASELDNLRRVGYVPVWLGPSVLRVETAAVTAAAALLITERERDRWAPTNI